ARLQREGVGPVRDPATKSVLPQRCYSAGRQMKGGYPRADSVIKRAEALHALALPTRAVAWRKQQVLGAAKARVPIRSHSAMASVHATGALHWLWQFPDSDQLVRQIA